MFSAFVKEDEINFKLFDSDYMSVYDVFNQAPQIPFGQEADLIKTINVKAFQDKPGGGVSKRYTNYSGQNKKDWNKGERKNVAEEEEDDRDPDWIDFDPEKNRDKFFGHVMADEQQLRETVLIKKKNKEERAEQKKHKAAEQAKMRQMTEEQRNIIAESKISKENLSELEQTKLQEAEALAA